MTGARTLEGDDKSENDTTTVKNSPNNRKRTTQIKNSLNSRTCEVDCQWEASEDARNQVDA